jgi:hypothetical protein
VAILKCFPAPGYSPILTIDVDVFDETLLAEICEGSREALATLFRRYARIFRGVAFRVLRDASEADNLLQDIFLLIYRKSAGSALNTLSTVATRRGCRTVGSYSRHPNDLCQNRDARVPRVVRSKRHLFSNTNLAAAGIRLSRDSQTGNRHRHRHSATSVV